MYAELCSRLGTELPELAPPAGETQPMSFQRLLLNTCQEEFEGTADARAVRAAPLSLTIEVPGPGYGLVAAECAVRPFQPRCQVAPAPNSAHHAMSMHLGVPP